MTRLDDRADLRLVLLGAFGAQVPGRSADPARWRLRKARALVAMLALAPGQTVHRELVLDRLWPDLDPEAAARNLHQTLYIARRALGAIGVPPHGLLVLRQDLIVLREGRPVDVDAVEFEERAGAAFVSGEAAALRSALCLYAGDLLPEWPDASWLAGPRDHLRATRDEVLLMLASTVRHTSPEESLVLLTGLLEREPLHEGGVRAEMLALVALGRRSEALARYERLVDGLLEEFGTDPDPQTSALFRRLLTSGPAGPGPTDRSVVHNEDAQLGCLPVPVTSFVGRRREVDEVGRILDHARLLTLTGAGGCGKTRVAIEAAEGLRSRYADGLWFVDLSAVMDGRLVVDAVAGALGLEAGKATDRERTLISRLRASSMLVVLDNCEHLLAACAQLVTAITAACPGVDVLATSREPLHAPGEHTFRVPSLHLPPPVGLEDPVPEDLAGHSSVELFVERARALRPGFAVTAANARSVAELCRRLDGIPLALELAAARTTVLDPSQIVQRLGDALSLLGEARGGVTRHETLRATLAWSHALLTHPEQVLLRRLAVFVGGFTIEAAESICAGAPLERADVFDLLGHLVEKSLVVAEPTEGSTRYRQLETVRQLGRENLRRADEQAALDVAHCAFFLERAVRHNPERCVGLVLEQPRLLDADHDNLRAALGWACTNDPQSALHLAASLWRFWFVRGHSIEGAAWVERALAGAPEPTRPRAAALVGLSGLDGRQGRSDRHQALGAEALSITRAIGEPHEVLAARMVTAALAWSTFDLARAEAVATEVRAEAEATGRPDQVAATSWLFAQCAFSREDGPGAAEHLHRCLDELGDVCGGTPFLPVVTPSIQLVSVDDRLMPCVEETLLLGRRVGAAQGAGYVLSALGDAARMSADLPTAIAAIGEARETFTDLGDELALGQVVHQLGCVLRASGDEEGAELALSRARTIRAGFGDRRGELLSRLHLALLRARCGDLDGALADAGRCLARFEAVGDAVGVGAALGMLAVIQLLAGDVSASRELYRQSAQRLSPWRRHAGWSWLVAAELSWELGHEDRARREAAQAAAAFGAIRCVLAGPRLDALLADKSACAMAPGSSSVPSAQGSVLRSALGTR